MKPTVRAVLCSTFLAAIATAVAVPAFADTIDNFTITEAATSTTLTFSLPSNPTPSTVNSSTEFTMDNVAISYDGGIPQTGYIFFLDVSPVVLDLHIPTESGYELFEIDSPTYNALFTGPTSSPVFNTGTFTGQDDNNQDPILVNISAAAPEPNSLALLGTGALGLAGVLRRRFIPSRA